mgnify:CR=1 FL=1
MSSYAPIEDGNQPDDYADYLAHYLPFPKRAVLDLFHNADPHVRNVQRLRMFMYFMAKYECGAHHNEPMETIDRGIEMYEADFCKEEV